MLLGSRDRVKSRSEVTPAPALPTALVALLRSWCPAGHWWWQQEFRPRPVLVCPLTSSCCDGIWPWNKALACPCCNMPADQLKIKWKIHNWLCLYCITNKWWLLLSSCAVDILWSSFCYAVGILQETAGWWNYMTWNGSMMMKKRYPNMTYRPNQTLCNVRLYKCLDVWWCKWWRSDGGVSVMWVANMNRHNFCLWSHRCPYHCQLCLKDQV